MIWDISDLENPICDIGDFEIRICNIGDFESPIWDISNCEIPICNDVSEFQSPNYRWWFDSRDPSGLVELLDLIINDFTLHVKSL